jgi:DNA-binding LacI/PurR family transcriptional regulator
VTLREAGYSVLLTNTGANSDVGLQNLRVLHRRRVDGLIVSVESESDERTQELLTKSSAPVLLLDREHVGAGCGTVLSDHAGGVRAATRHLLELGHRRIAIITGPATVHPTRSRMDGYRSAHELLGVALDESLTRTGRHTREFGYEQTFALLELPDPPTALIAAGASIAIGVLAAARAAGIHLPDQLSVVACDDHEVLQLHTPAIDVVRRDARELGRTAARLLLHMIDGAAAPDHLVLPTEYVVRASVAGPQHGRSRAAR